MNQFIKVAIENMEWVEHDHDRERPIIDLRIQKTNEAIAYALIAIAEVLEAQQSTAMDSLASNRIDEKPSYCGACDERMGSMSIGWRTMPNGQLLCPRCYAQYSADMLIPGKSPLS